MSKRIENPDIPVVRAEEVMKRAHHDSYFDRPFLKILVRDAKRISPSIDAFFFKGTNILIFVRDGIVIYKVVLDEYNTSELMIHEHLEKIIKMVKLIDSGSISSEVLASIRNNSKNLALRGHEV